VRRLAWLLCGPRGGAVNPCEAGGKLEADFARERERAQHGQMAPEPHGRSASER